MEELTRLVLTMNPKLAPGPDGIGGKFYQTNFDIIEVDFLSTVQYFFNGQDMPKP